MSEAGMIEFQIAEMLASTSLVFTIAASIGLCLVLIFRLVRKIKDRG